MPGVGMIAGTDACRVSSLHRVPATRSRTTAVMLDVPGKKRADDRDAGNYLRTRRAGREHAAWPCTSEVAIAEVSLLTAARQRPFFSRFARLHQPRCTSLGWCIGG